MVKHAITDITTVINSLKRKGDHYEKTQGRNASTELIAFLE